VAVPGHGVLHGAGQRGCREGRRGHGGPRPRTPLTPNSTRLPLKTRCVGLLHAGAPFGKHLFLLNGQNCSVAIRILEYHLCCHPTYPLLRCRDKSMWGGETGAGPSPDRRSSRQGPRDARAPGPPWGGGTLRGGGRRPGPGPTGRGRSRPAPRGPGRRAPRCRSTMYERLPSGQPTPGAQVNAG